MPDELGMASSEDVRKACNNIQRTNGPMDVGLSEESLAEAKHMCLQTGVDWIAFCSGLAVGMEVRRIVEEANRAR